MRYACLVYGEFAERLASTAAEWDMTVAAYRAFNRGNGPGGLVAAGAALRPGNTALTVRVRAGEATITPGPPEGSLEHLGGLYLIDCADLDEALAFAVRIPGAEWGSVEVRPVLDMG